MFRTEKHLADKIKIELSRNPSLLLKMKGNLNPIVFEELNIGHGIADLVISFCKKIRKRTESLNLFEINLLKIIQNIHLIHILDLQDIVKTKNSKLNKAIDKLEKEGFISFDNGEVCLINEYENYLAEAMAIEVKLKNWKRALEQAYRYRSFAYQSYVFMDQKYIAPAIKNKELFLKYNVGLAGVSPNGDIEIIYTPVKGNPFDDTMNMLLNESIVTHHLSCKKVNHVSK